MPQWSSQKATKAQIGKRATELSRLIFSKGVTKAESNCLGPTQKNTRQHEYGGISTWLAPCRLVLAGKPKGNNNSDCHFVKSHPLSGRLEGNNHQSLTFTTPEAINMSPVGFDKRPKGLRRNGRGVYGETSRNSNPKGMKVRRL